MVKSIYYILSLLLLSGPVWSLELQYSQHDTIEKLIDDSLHALPLLMHERLKSNRLVIHVVTLPNTEIANLDFDRQEIEVNRHILDFKYENLRELKPDAWLEDSKKHILFSKHHSLYDLFVGSLIHEIAHFYDLKGFPHYEYLKTRKYCIYAAVSRQSSYEPECRMIQDIKKTISDSPEFLQLAGFPKRGFLIQDNDSLNSQKERSPDAYEFTSPDEAFAVNFEFFILDSDFRCRRPLLYSYYARQFDYLPFPKANCDTDKHVLIQYSTPASFDEQWQELDLSKLYEVHYLWAGPGPEVFSKFGHAMLRLVFCAKNRTVMGPECLNDVYAHRIISFRAAIDDFQISSMKGLTGNYPNYLYFLSASDVISEYTRSEFRTIYSLPLKLNETEKRRIVLAALEAHWSYKGSYKFLTNNCAHETLNLLQTALVNRPRFLAQSVVRPDSLYDLLIDQGLADSQNDRSHIEGSFSPLKLQSQRRLLEENLNVLKLKGYVENNKDLESYFSLPSKLREQILLNAINEFKKTGKKQGLYGFLNLAELQLEQLTLQKMKQKLPSFIEYIQTKPFNADLDVTQITNLLKKMMSANQVIDLGQSYGIPTRSEIAKMNLDEARVRFEETKKLIKQVLILFRDFLPESERGSLAEEEKLVAMAQAVLPRYK